MKKTKKQKEARLGPICNKSFQWLWVYSATQPGITTNQDSCYKSPTSNYKMLFMRHKFTLQYMLLVWLYLTVLLELLKEWATNVPNPENKEYSNLVYYKYKNHWEEILIISRTIYQKNKSAFYD